jgi:DUF2934 family protein
MSKKGNSSSPAVRKPAVTKSVPTHDEIASRAYQIYLERGGTPGHALEDWTRAEQELLQKNGKLQRKNGAKSVAA